MDGQGDTLGDDGEGADLAHLHVGSGEEDDELVRKDDAEDRHHKAAPEGHLAGEAVGFLHPVIALGTPVEAGHGLEAVAEAQDDAEGEHHDLGAHADAGQDGVGEVAGQLVQQDAGDDGETIAEHGGRAHGDDLRDDLPAGTEIPDGQVQQAPPGHIGEDQDHEADHLGNGGGEGRTGDTHVEMEDENGVEDDVQNAAEAHAHHGKGGAALGSEALVHDEVAGHEGSGHEHVGGVIDGIGFAGGGGAQEANHGGHENGAEDQQTCADGEGGVEGGGQHPAGLFILVFAQEPGDVGVGTHGQHGAAHHDQLIQGGVDADRRRGVGA